MGTDRKKKSVLTVQKTKNVFDIQQGVAIALFIKKQGEKKQARVYHSDIWGLRKSKYNWLLENNIKTTNWQELSPKI